VRERRQKDEKLTKTTRKTTRVSKKARLFALMNLTSSTPRLAIGQARDVDDVKFKKAPTFFVFIQQKHTSTTILS
jgi:hypothetical protein